MKSDRAVQLLRIAREISNQDRDFQAVKGPGAGNRATNAFLKRLRERATSAFSEDFSEKRICGDTSQAVDFYIPSEATIVEVALGLPNPASEYEKDILKAIMAQGNGYRVRRLFFISRPGASRKCQQPGRAAIATWAKAKHDLVIEVQELDGEPRRRVRKTDGKGKSRSAPYASPFNPC